MLRYTGGVAYLALLASCDISLWRETLERLVGGRALVSPVKLVARASRIHYVELPIYTTQEYIAHNKYSYYMYMYNTPVIEIMLIL